VRYKGAWANDKPVHGDGNRDGADSGTEQTLTRTAYGKELEKKASTLSVVPEDEEESVPKAEAFGNDALTTVASTATSSIYTLAQTGNGTEEDVGELRWGPVNEPGQVWKMDPNGPRYFFICHRGVDSKEEIAGLVVQPHVHMCCAIWVENRVHNVHEHSILHKIQPLVSVVHNSNRKQHHRPCQKKGSIGIMGLCQCRQKKL